jgi:hypothetical protein
MTKLIVFSDRGSLDVWADEISYRGRKFRFAMPKIFGVSIIRQQIPWVSYAIANVAALPCFVVAYFIGMFTGDLFIGVLAAVLMGALIIGSNLLGLLIARSTKWIFVEFQDESNQFRDAYLADGSLLGWGGLLGGTKRLYRTLQEHAYADRA